ncbi:hypothetical protein N7528_003730 [Penicillium herquei]|nr:hypothetical protein N7528_003730 [Penicillium herquei]
MRGLPNLRAKLSKLRAKLRSSFRSRWNSLRLLTRQSNKTSPEFAFLPLDVLWLILDHLTPRDVVRCRRVSQLWNAAFSNPLVLAYMLKQHFPWTNESQSLQLTGMSELTIDDVRHIHDKVVARYHHLEKGSPRSVKKYDMCNPINEDDVSAFARVPAWNLHTSHLTNRPDRLFPEAMWSHEDGLVVFPSKRWDFIAMLDLETNRKYVVPFLMSRKTIRRIRLHMQVLVIEWVEDNLYRSGRRFPAYNHFASSFDIVRRNDGSWNIIPRNEWQIDARAGYPIGQNDVFFSAHNRDYYAIYLWQPNLTFSARDTGPRETLTVWDISPRSFDRSSEDSTGTAASMGDEGNVPSFIAKFDLNHLDLRQRGIPNLQRLHITNDGASIVITECFNTWMHMIGDDLGLPRVIQTTLPLQGIGPHQHAEEDLLLPPYRSNSNIKGNFMTRDVLNVDGWYDLLGQALDDNSGVSFCLHFDNVKWFEHSDKEDQEDLPLKLTIQTKNSRVTCETLDFSGAGQISGGENYVIGENRDNQLVIYRFD